MLFIEYQELENPEIYSTNAYYKKRKIDQAGVAYEKLKLKIYNLKNNIYHEEIETKSISSTNEELEGKFDKKNIENKRKIKNKELQNKTNYYEILGFYENYAEVTTNMIKKNYKKLALLFHPDKYKEGEYNEDEKNKWLDIKNAYETLTDETARRKYDSLVEFDDTVPKKCDPEDFFKTFEAIFKRNGFFSKNKNIPNIGDEKSNWNKVKKFYEFWENFQSTRDFVVDDEYDLSQAESRYEKRYMERENKKMKSDLYKKEKKRIKTLVENAKQSDPRIIQIEKERIEKERKREEEKRLKKERRIMEEKKKKDEERLRIETENQRILDEKIKKELETKQKNEERKLCINNFKDTVLSIINETKYDIFFVEGFVDKKTNENLMKIREYIIKEGKMKGIELFEKIKKEQELKRKEILEKSKNKPKAKQIDLSKWNLEDIRKLTKAVLKFSSGYKDRWVQINKVLNNKFSIEELIFMSKEISIRSIQSEESMKNFLNSINKDNNQNKWSQEQQKQLELALKKIPTTLSPKERWLKIGDEVEGKTAKECLERYKFLKAKLKK